MNSQNTEQYKMMQPRDFHKIMDGIDRALVTFETTSNYAVVRLYKQSYFASAQKSTPSPEENPLLTESEHEHIFLVYLSVERVLFVSRHYTDGRAALFLPFRSSPGS